MLSHHGAAAQPRIDILDAESDLQAAIERHGRLYQPNFGALEGLLVHVDCDVRRGIVLAHLVQVDARGDIVKNVDTVRLDHDGAVAAAARVDFLLPDEHGDVWSDAIYAAITVMP